MTSPSPSPSNSPILQQGGNNNPTNYLGNPESFVPFNPKEITQTPLAFMGGNLTGLLGTLILGGIIGKSLSRK